LQRLCLNITYFNITRTVAQKGFSTSSTFQINHPSTSSGDLKPKRASSRIRKTPLVVETADKVVKITSSEAAQSSANSNPNNITITVRQTEPLATNPVKVTNKRTRKKTSQTTTISTLKRKKNLSFKEFLLLKFTMFNMYILAFISKYYIIALIMYMATLSLINIYWILGINIKDLLYNILIISIPEDFDFNIYEGSNTLKQFLLYISSQTQSIKIQDTIDYINQLSVARSDEAGLEPSGLGTPLATPEEYDGGVAALHNPEWNQSIPKNKGPFSDDEVTRRLPVWKTSPESFSTGPEGYEGNNSSNIAVNEPLKLSDTDYTNLPGINECPYLINKYPKNSDGASSDEIWVKPFVSKNHYNSYNYNANSLFLKPISWIQINIFNLIFNSTYFPSFFKPTNLPLVEEACESFGSTESSFTTYYMKHEGIRNTNNDVANQIKHYLELKSTAPPKSPSSIKEGAPYPKGSGSPVTEALLVPSEADLYSNTSKPNIEQSHLRRLSHNDTLINNYSWLGYAEASKQLIQATYLYIWGGITQIYYSGLSLSSTLWNSGLITSIAKPQELIPTETPSTIFSETSTPIKCFRPNEELKTILELETYYATKIKYDELNLTDYTSDQGVTSPIVSPYIQSPTTHITEELVQAYRDEALQRAEFTNKPKYVKTNLSLAIPETDQFRRNPPLDSPNPKGSDREKVITPFISLPTNIIWNSSRSPLIPLSHLPIKSPSASPLSAITNFISEREFISSESPILNSLREKDYDITAGTESTKLNKVKFKALSPMEILRTTPLSPGVRSSGNFDIWDYANWILGRTSMQQNFYSKAADNKLLYDLIKVTNIDNQLSDINNGIYNNLSICRELNNNLTDLKDSVFPHVLQKYKLINSECTSSIHSLKTLEAQCSTTSNIKRNGLFVGPYSPENDFNDIFNLMTNSHKKLSVYNKTLNDYGVLSYNYNNKLHEDLKTLEEIFDRSIQLKSRTSGITYDIHKKLVDYMDYNNIKKKDEINSFWDSIKKYIIDPNFSLTDKLKYTGANPDTIDKWSMQWTYTPDYLADSITSFKKDLERTRNLVKFSNSSLVPLNNSYNRLSWGASNFKNILDDFNRTLKIEDKKLYDIMTKIPPQFK